MNEGLFQKLHAEGLLGDTSFARLEQKRLNPRFSVFWEIKTLLYVGIILLTSGLGILVYKNIDSLSHIVILLFIALVTAACFVYCFRIKKPFSKDKVTSPSTFFDYILLLGAVSFLIFTGYLQYQYNVFGSNYGLATFIPMLVLFYLAYDFDHIGILNMAIVNLGIWMGVSVTPKNLLLSYTFDSQSIILTYFGFSLLLLAGAWLTQKFKVKPHFKFSYYHYGMHVCIISLLAGYFYNYDSGFCMLYMLGAFTFMIVIYRDSFKQKNLYFLVCISLYAYFAISALVTRFFIKMPDEGAFTLLLFYFIGSAIGFVFFLINLNKKLKAA